jgi:MFS transporter, YNFM family, putative membrane transport protein
VTDDADDWVGHRRGSREYRLLLAALFCAGIATFAQLYSPQAALASIARDFDVSPADSALVVSAATIGLAIGVIPWSIVADRTGRVRAMTVAIVVATAFGLLVPFAPDFGLLLAGRLLEGFFVGGVPAVALAYLNEEVEPAHAARAAGTYVAGTTIGGLAGRLIAGPIADAWNWRAGVFITALVCAAAAAAFVRLAPPARGFVAGRPRGRFVVNRRQLAIYTQAFLLMGGFVALYNFLGFRLEAAPFALAPALASLVFIAYLAGTWSSSRAGALATRVGRLPVLLGGTTVMIAGVLLTLSDVLAVVLAGLVLATAGFFAAHAVASGWAGAAAVGGRAQAASLYNLAYYAGSSLFGWLGGVFFVNLGWGAITGMIVTIAVLAVAVAVAGLRTAHLRPERVDT